MSIGPFLPLFGVEVEHEFFDDGLLRDVRFVPTSESLALMRRAGILVRKTSSGIELHYDGSRSEALQLFLDEADGELCFQFKVHVRDGVFKNVSEGFLSTQEAIPYFKNESGAEDGGRIRLHTASQASARDLVPIASDSFAGLLDARDLRLPPAFALRIVFPSPGTQSLEKALDSGPARYFVKFGARKTYWTYYLLGPLADKRVSIVDLDDSIDFESLGPVSLSDAHPALAFRSKAAISLRQRPTCRFQLREAGTGNGKPLIRRLPVAASSRVNRQTIRGEVISISEVYVNG